MTPTEKLALATATLHRLAVWDDADARDTDEPLAAQLSRETLAAMGEATMTKEDGR